MKTLESKISWLIIDMINTNHDGVYPVEEVTKVILKAVEEALPKDIHVNKNDDKYNKEWSHGYNICLSQIKQILKEGV